MLELDFLSTVRGVYKRVDSEMTNREHYGRVSQQVEQETAVGLCGEVSRVTGTSVRRVHARTAMRDAHSRDVYTEDSGHAVA